MRLYRVLPWPWSIGNEDRAVHKADDTWTSTATVIALNIASNDNARALLDEEWEPVAVDSTTEVLPAGDDAEEAIVFYRRSSKILLPTQRGTILSFTTCCSLQTDVPLYCTCASDSEDVG